MRPTRYAAPQSGTEAGHFERNLFGLAPGGVCRVPSRLHVERGSPDRRRTLGAGPRALRRRAVVSYTTISPFSLHPDSAGVKGCVFSVTLSVPAGCSPRDPRLTRGALPPGVRTFLPVPMLSERSGCPVDQACSESSCIGGSDHPPMISGLPSARSRTSSRIPDWGPDH